MAIDATFETGKLYPLPTAPTGQAVLIVDSIPLNTLPGTADNLAYLAVGKDCLTTLDELGGGGPQPIGGGSSTKFAIPAGSQRVSFHTDPFNCTDKSLYPEVLFNLAWKRAYLVLYSLDDKGGPAPWSSRSSHRRVRPRRSTLRGPASGTCRAPTALMFDEGVFRAPEAN